MSQYAHRGWVSYLVALGAMVVAVFVRVVLTPQLFAGATFIPLFAAILLAAWYGGLGPGLMATGLGAIASAWFLLPPTDSLWITGRWPAIQLLLYCSLAVAICIACESLHAARRRTAAMRADIHDLQRMEDELRQLAADLSEADRRKDRFLAMLSHELRNPLAPIRNALELMKRAGGDQGRIESAREAMERQITHMVRLVDDLLDVSRITRDKLELRRETVPLGDIVDSAVETVAPMVEQRGHRLQIDLPPEPLYLDVDPARTSQVLSNLLNNASKYTDPGGRLRLSAHVEGDQAVIVVADNGIGVQASDIPLALEMFGQVDQTLERSQGGLGIGLSLAKRLVELHGGSIAMRPAPTGAGTEVEIRLPIASAPSPARPAPAAKRNAHRQRILVVDDNIDSARTLSMMLEAMGHETHLAHDGEAAVQAADAIRPSLVLLDIGLPRLNGYEACRRIRDLPWAGDSIHIVAVTGWGQEEDRRRSREAGFDRHLVKPLDPAAVLDLMAELGPAR